MRKYLFRWRRSDKQTGWRRLEDRLRRRRGGRRGIWGRRGRRTEASHRSKMRRRGALQRKRGRRSLARRRRGRRRNREQPKGRAWRKDRGGAWPTNFLVPCLGTL